MMTFNVKRLWTTLCLTLAFSLLAASLASAHVTVTPTTSAPKAWTTYTIKIPTEKDLPTVKITLKMPAGMILEQVQPLAGWKTATQKDDNGNKASVTWEAEDEGLLPGQFQQFSFVAQNPSNEGPVAWDAYQYYSDGTVVEWTGEEGGDTPHSITEITAAAQNTDEHAGHGEAANNAAQPEAAADDADSKGSLDAVTLIISLAALVISLLTLWYAMRSSRRKA